MLWAHSSETFKANTNRFMIFYFVADVWACWNNVSSDQGPSFVKELPTLWWSEHLTESWCISEHLIAFWCILVHERSFSTSRDQPRSHQTYYLYRASSNNFSSLPLLKSGSNLVQSESKSKYSDSNFRLGYRFGIWLSKFWIWIANPIFWIQLRCEIQLISHH